MTVFARIAALLPRIGSFFLCFLLLTGLAEGFAQAVRQQQWEDEESRMVAALASRFASLSQEEAAEFPKKLPEGSRAWRIEEETAKPGQLASRKKRVVRVSHDGAAVGKAPSEALALLAANVKSRALEKRLGAETNREEGFYRATAPVLIGDAVVGAVVVEVSPRVVSTEGASLLSISLWSLLGAMAAALLSLLPKRRGVVQAACVFLFGSLVALSYRAQVAAMGVAIAATLLLVLIAYWQGSGTFSRHWKSLSASGYAYAYIAPAMLGMFVLVFVPFLVGVGISFFEHRFGDWSFVGFENFSRILFADDGLQRGLWERLFSTESFYYKLAVTLLWTTSNVFFHVSIGLGLALLLNQSDLRGKVLYRVILILPWAVPSYITALIWKRMFHPNYGIINELLGTPGMSWSDSFWKAFFANLCTNIWLGVPFMMVVCLGALQSIPKDIYEAAEIDGASRWQQFWKITVPLLRPALLPSIVLGMVWTFNMFNVIYLVSEGKPSGATDILITEAYRAAFERQENGGDYGYAAAYSTIIFLILLVYSLGTAKVTGLQKGIDD